MLHKLSHMSPHTHFENTNKIKSSCAHTNTTHNQTDIYINAIVYTPERVHTPKSKPRTHTNSPETRSHIPPKTAQHTHTHAYNGSRARALTHSLHPVSEHIGHIDPFNRSTLKRLSHTTHTLSHNQRRESTRTQPHTRKTTQTPRVRPKRQHTRTPTHQPATNAIERDDTIDMRQEASRPVPVRGALALPHSRHTFRSPCLWPLVC